ncbi:MAG: metallopeptidase family protein [Candidatus Wallbacteria bacterium]|nr:metallopeptidase family protein [Candidatus Wallbacteria bacterium]
MRQPIPSFEEFSRLLEAMVAQVPPEFLRGLGGIYAVPEERRDGNSKDVYLLGEYHQRQDGKFVFLYYGSFLAMGWRDGRKFERELRDTLLHELRHHWEEAAGLPDLRREDAERLDGFRRRGGTRRRGRERRSSAAEVGRALAFVLGVIATMLAIAFALELLGRL